MATEAQLAEAKCLEGEAGGQRSMARAMLRMSLYYESHPDLGRDDLVQAYKDLAQHDWNCAQGLIRGWLGIVNGSSAKPPGVD